MTNKYPYDSNERPIHVSPYHKISDISVLMQAVLLNIVDAPLSQINYQIDGWTALMIAAANSNTWSTERTVKMLIDAGANVNLKNQHEQSAIMIAASHYDESTENTIKLLIDAGANLDFQDEYGRTALIMAKELYGCANSTIRVHALVNSGTNLGLKTRFNLTALMYATRCTKSMRILLNKILWNAQYFEIFPIIN